MNCIMARNKAKSETETPWVVLMVLPQNYYMSLEDHLTFLYPRPHTLKFERIMCLLLPSMTFSFIKEKCYINYINAF